MIAQGEVWWADIPAPVGSGRVPAACRCDQGDAINQSRIAAVICVPLTTNLRWADAPGNVLVQGSLTGLPRDSVANVSQIVALDRDLLTERAGKLPKGRLRLILAGIDVLMGR